MTKILVTSWLSRDAPSGVITHIRKLREFFAGDPGIDMTFLHLDDAPRRWHIVASILRRLIRFPGFFDPKYIELSFELYNRLMLYGGLTRYRHTHFDVINAHDPLSGYVAKRFFHDRIPLVMTCHFNNNPVDEEMMRYGLKEPSRRLLTMRYKKKFAAVDEFIFAAGFTIRTAGFLLPRNARTTVIYNGLDFGDPTRPRRQAGYFSILNTGHVEKRKNQQLFIPMAKELLHRNFNNFRITLVGLGPDLERLRSIVSREGLTEYFHFAGWSDDVPAFLETADIYIHTALLETCPYSVMEAIAAGVPALAFNVGGLPEMLPRDSLFSPNDHIGMVDYLLGHQGQLADIGARQHERAKMDFSRTVQIERLRSIYTKYNRQP